MEAYWVRRPRAETAQDDIDTEDSDPSLGTEFDRYRRTLVAMDDNEGWAAELRRYLKDMPANVSRDTDIVEWWQVSISPTRLLFYSDTCLVLKNHCQLYPTLASIALDILPCQASSVPCERLFSASKQTADDRRSRLGPRKFEELQVMKFAWRKNAAKHVASKSDEIEEVDLEMYHEMLASDHWEDEFDKTEDEIVLDN